MRSKAAESLLAEHAESRAALADLRSQRDAVVDELVRLRGWLDEVVSADVRRPRRPCSAAPARAVRGWVRGARRVRTTGPDRPIPAAREPGAGRPAARSGGARRRRGPGGHRRDARGLRRASGHAGRPVRVRRGRRRPPRARSVRRTGEYGRPAVTRPPRPATGRRSLPVHARPGGPGHLDPGGRRARRVGRRLHRHRQHAPSRASPTCRRVGPGRGARALRRGPVRRAPAGPRPASGADRSAAGGTRRPGADPEPVTVPIDLSATRGRRRGRPGGRPLRRPPARPGRRTGPGPGRETSRARPGRGGRGGPGTAAPPSGPPSPRENPVASADVPRAPRTGAARGPRGRGAARGPRGP